MRNRCKLLAPMPMLFISAVAFSAEQKPVIGVGEIASADLRVPGNSRPIRWDTENMRTAIETAISKTGKFTLMERSRLNALLEERGLSMSGVTEGIQSISGFSGVDYLLYGRITQVALDNKSLLLLTQCDATLGVDVRVVDTATAEIRLSENVRLSKNVAMGGADENSCAGLPMNSLEELSISAAESVAEKLTVALFPIKIANVTGDQVFLNYGEPFLQKGDYVKIVRLGEGFVDPDTGEVLGAQEVQAGVLVVSDVRARYSIADVRLRQGDFGVGDVAQKVSSKKEVSALRAQLSAISKNADKARRACERAQKTEQRRCRKEGARCDAARQATTRACG